MIIENTFTNPFEILLFTNPFNIDTTTSSDSGWVDESGNFWADENGDTWSDE